MSSSGDMKSLLTGCLGLIAAMAPAIAQVQPVAPSVEPPTPVAGSKVVWLVMRGGYLSDQSFFAIPTASMDQCETSGAELVSSKRLNYRTESDYVGFECVEGIR